VDEVVRRVAAHLGSAEICRPGGRPCAQGLYDSVVLVIHLLRRNPVQAVAAEFFRLSQSSGPEPHWSTAPGNHADRERVACPRPLYPAQAQGLVCGRPSHSRLRGRREPGIIVSSIIPDDHHRRHMMISEVEAADTTVRP
jgi:hypothetical protein